MRLSVQVLEFVSVFIEASKISVYNIFFNKQPQNLKTIGACRKSSDLILKTFKKIYSYGKKIACLGHLYMAEWRLTESISTKFF